MGPKKDKKKKKPVSKRLAATNLSKKEIQAFINRHKAINQKNYGGGAKVSRLSKADAKQYADMRNFYSPAMSAPKTLNIPVGTSPRDFFLSEEAQRAKTIFAKLQEENAFRAKLREVELEELKLKWEPTIMNYKEKIYEDQHALNLRKAEYNQKIEEMKHEKVLLDLASTEQTTKNKYDTDRIKLANATANHLKRNGRASIVKKNGVEQYEYNDPNSLAKKQHEENIQKLAVEAQAQDQQFALDELKTINEHNKTSLQIGGSIIDAKGNVVNHILKKQSMLAKKQATDEAEENVKQANYEYEQEKEERALKFREEQAESKWKPITDKKGRQLYNPYTYKPLWEGTGQLEAFVEQKEDEIKELTFKAEQTQKKKQLEQKLKEANTKVKDVINIDGHTYQNLHVLVDEVYADQRNKNKDVWDKWHIPSDDDDAPAYPSYNNQETYEEEEWEEPYEEEEEEFEWEDEKNKWGEQNIWKDYKWGDDYNPDDPNVKNQIRQQNAVNQLNHNIQEPVSSNLPPEQQLLHPETQVNINQPLNNGVNEQVAVAELQQATAEAQMRNTEKKNKPLNDTGEWWHIEGEAERNSGLYKKNSLQNGRTWDDFYKKQTRYAEQRLEQFLKTDEKDMADWNEDFKELLLYSKPYINGKVIPWKKEDEEDAEVDIREHMASSDWNKPYPNQVPPSLARELLLAKIRNPKRELYNLMMDKKDKEIYFHELPELARSDIAIPMPNTYKKGNLALGKKIYKIKSQYASSENIDAHLRTMFSTNLDEVLSINDDPDYDVYG